MSTKMERTMPRPPLREDVPPAELEAFDYVYGREKSKHRSAEPFEMKGYFGAMLNSPPMAELYSRLGSFFRTAGEHDSYQHWERELVDQVISAEWKTNAVMAMHVRDAVAVGMRPEAIHAIRHHDDSRLTPDELQLVEYVRDVVHGRVSQEAFDALVKRYGSVRKAVEYTGFTTFLMMTIRNIEALGGPHPSDDEIDRIIQGYLDGTEAIPDPRRGFN
jgi:alkylhydroperoxidase family enzyme